jgi:hypothetical protein
MHRAGHYISNHDLHTKQAAFGIITATRTFRTEKHPRLSQTKLTHDKEKKHINNKLIIQRQRRIRPQQSPKQEESKR